MNNKSKKLNLPFIMDGGKKTNIFNDKQLDLKFNLKNIGLINVIDKLTKTNNNSEINIIKASESKNYYKKLNKNNSK